MRPPGLRATQAGKQRRCRSGWTSNYTWHAGFAATGGAGAGIMLGDFVRTISERIAEVRAHAGEEGVDTEEPEASEAQRYA